MAIMTENEANVKSSIQVDRHVLLYYLLLPFFGTKPHFVVIINSEYNIKGNINNVSFTSI